MINPASVLRRRDIIVWNDCSESLCIHSHHDEGQGQGAHIRTLRIDYGKRLAPVALPCKQPVPQLEIDLCRALALLFKPPDHGGCCFRCFLAVQAQTHRCIAGVCRRSLPCDISMMLCTADSCSVQRPLYNDMLGQKTQQQQCLA